MGGIPLWPRAHPDFVNGEITTPASPAKKDKKKWCRGKVGVSHDLMMGYPRNQAGWRKECRWVAKCKWVIVDDHREWTVINPKDHWLCSESEFCRNCGKVLRDGLGEDCTRKERNE